FRAGLNPMGRVLRLVKATSGHQVEDMFEALVSRGQIHLADLDYALHVEILELVFPDGTGTIDMVVLVALDLEEVIDFW
ncbi:hypothetical protein BZM27_55870, partial [Paraburkholderia steynii]